MRIFKYPLAITGVQQIEMPLDAKILTAQFQGEVPYIWALVSPDNPTRSRTIFIVGTGHEATHVANAPFITTIQQFGGALVWHLFDGG